MTSFGQLQNFAAECVPINAVALEPYILQRTRFSERLALEISLKHHLFISPLIAITWCLSRGL